MASVLAYSLVVAGSNGRDVAVEVGRDPSSDVKARDDGSGDGPYPFALVDDVPKTSTPAAAPGQ